MNTNLFLRISANLRVKILATAALSNGAGAISDTVSFITPFFTRMSKLFSRAIEGDALTSISQHRNFESIKTSYPNTSKLHG